MPFPAIPATPSKGLDQSLAAGLAHHLSALASGSQAPAASVALLGRAAQAISRATSLGHSCLPLAEILGTGQPAAVKEARDTLLTSGLVGKGEVGEPSLPLVLDQDNRLYLGRYFAYEGQLATLLMARATPTPADAEPEQAIAGTDFPLALGLWPPWSDDQPPDWQRLAAAMAIRQRLTIISGGPGTGKTTTVVNLLACLLAKRPELRVALAAHTGKAAQRMMEAIRARASHLPEELRRLLPNQATTIHRLLGVIPGSHLFRHHQDNPLAIDCLIVDEASMLDLALAVKLLAAVPEGAKLVLLGDKDQLAAVEAGAVFSEISTDPAISEPCRQQLAALTGIHAEKIVPPLASRPSPLQNAVVWLTENYRFGKGSAIGQLAAAVNRQDAEAALAILRQPPGHGVVNDHGVAQGRQTTRNCKRLQGAPDARKQPASYTGVCEQAADKADGVPCDRLYGVRWLEDGDTILATASLAELIAGFTAYLQAVGQEKASPEAVFAAFDSFRILCAVRDSERGVDWLNGQLAATFRHRLNHPLDDGASRWYPGRPVMILRNDYGLKLFNGDIGIILANPQGKLMAHFPVTGHDFRLIDPVRLPAHETAFTMTVHKAQGSEFDQVALVLPAYASQVLTKELIYTAITRARQQVTIIGSAPVLGEAIARQCLRPSGLITRMERHQEFS